jgi:hypothetical protein
MIGTALEANRFSGQGAACMRCDGLLVSEDCMDLLDETGEIRFKAWRCVCCGNLIDTVIVRNRKHRGEPRRSRVKRTGVIAV